MHCETKSLVRIYDYNLSDKQRSRKGSKANPPQWFEYIEKVSSIRNASDASYARFQSDRVSGVGEYERCTCGCEGVEKVRIGRWGLGVGTYEDFVRR